MPRKHKQSLDDWTAEIAERIAKRNPQSSTSSLPYIEPNLSTDEVTKRVIALLTFLQRNNQERFPKVLEDIIYSAFTWSTTPQGTDFWVDISRTLLELDKP